MIVTIEIETVNAIDAVVPSLASGHTAEIIQNPRVRLQNALTVVGTVSQRANPILDRVLEIIHVVIRVKMVTIK